MAPILDVNNTTGDFITLRRDYIGRQYVIELLTRKVHITPQGLNTANWDILLLALKHLLLPQNYGQYITPSRFSMVKTIKNVHLDLRSMYMLSRCIRDGSPHTTVPHTRNYIHSF